MEQKVREHESMLNKVDEKLDKIQPTIIKANLLWAGVMALGMAVFGFFLK